MEFIAFAIPSITKAATSESMRTLEGLIERPNYMCINHIFEIEGRRIPIVMTMKGDAIDGCFKTSWGSNILTFEYMPAYKESLHEQAMRAAELARQQTS